MYNGSKKFTINGHCTFDCTTPTQYKLCLLMGTLYTCYTHKKKKKNETRWWKWKGKCEKREWCSENYCCLRAPATYIRKQGHWTFSLLLQPKQHPSLTFVLIPLCLACSFVPRVCKKKRKIKLFLSVTHSLCCFSILFKLNIYKVFVLL